MEADHLDFLEKKEAEEVTPEPQVEQPAIAEETPEPMGEKPAEIAPSAPPAPEPEPTRVPITALLDEREKRQATERELQELRRWKEQLEAQQRQQQIKTPDIYEDPEGFIRQTQATMQQALWNERLNMSEAIARTQYGDETVETARNAFAQAVQSSPALYAEMRQHPNPYAYVVNWHKRQSILSEIGNDPDKWREQERERIRQEILAQAQPSPKPTAPPPSLSKAPSRGTDAIAPGNVFDSLFPG